MKKIIIPFICILSILLVLLNINSLTTKITNILEHPSFNTLNQPNIYYKNTTYSFATNTNNFTPYGKQDLLNIIYSIINHGTKNFSFTCPKAYQNCLEDLNNFSKDANLLTHLNNFVHPFNSFTSINTTIYDGGEINIKVKYLYTEEEITKLNTEINKIISTLITPDITEDYDKIKTIHDYIINETKYDLDNNKELKSYNAYGALFNKVATCNGYTDLMALFLTNMGYENIKVATTSSTNNLEGHVWNAVKLNNEWLHLDLTWDDPVSSNDKNYLYHKYFLINTEELKTADSNITSTEHDFDLTIYPELKTFS